MNVPIIRVKARAGCRACGGSGVVSQYHPYGSTVAREDLTCECFEQNMTEEQLEQLDEGLIDVEITPAGEEG